MTKETHNQDKTMITGVITYESIDYVSNRSKIVLNNELTNMDLDEKYNLKNGTQLHIRNDQSCTNYEEKSSKKNIEDDNISVIS